ncbi:alpha/beta hydrolase [Vallitalea pronyensis]|uniref:Alpha/beta hydrolase n=1 Tax=Vallitalea pronyensis TaxID=1348613 RepID=A0A8J8MPY3_9FIRM|nr:alpha/beta hydrolase [Vallitalea pronyensis]QUI25417.1 alpha/beta hydrolase [Vallitalea pronyensis]
MKKPMKFIILLIVLIVIYFVINYIQYRSFTKNASENEQLNIHQSEIFNLSYGKIEYTTFGIGPSILILHGVTGDVDQGLGIVERYFPDGYQYIIVSRMGYSDSDIPDSPTVAIQCEIYNELLDHLSIDEVFVFGNSAGGTSAIKFADMYPNRTLGLILQSSNLPYDEVMSAPPKAAAKLIFGNDFLYWWTLRTFGDALFIKSFVGEKKYDLLTNEQKSDIIDDYFLGSLPITSKLDGIVFDFYQSNPAINEPDFFDHQIDTPTLVLRGTYDTSIPEEGILNLQSHLTNTQVQYYDAGHFLYNMDDLIKNDIEEFINQTIGGTHAK